MIKKKKLNENATQILGLLRLTIHNCTQADVGKYTCRIYNTHGEDVCHAELVYDSEYRIKKCI